MLQNITNTTVCIFSFVVSFFSAGLIGIPLAIIFEPESNIHGLLTVAIVLLIGIATMALCSFRWSSVYSVNSWKLTADWLLLGFGCGFVMFGVMGLIGYAATA
jgi:hypothetical protein